MKKFLSIINLQVNLNKTCKISKGRNPVKSEIEFEFEIFNEYISVVMKNAIEPIMSKMMSTLSSCAPSARKPRLQLLDQILEQIEDFNFLSQATGELVLCTKDNNAISRNLAYRILNRIFQRYIDGED